MSHTATLSLCETFHLSEHGFSSLLISAADSQRAFSCCLVLFGLPFFSPKGKDANLESPLQCWEIQCTWGCVGLCVVGSQVAQAGLVVPR